MLFRRYIALFLLVTLCAKVLIVPCILLDFELRKAYIVSNFCENKNRPELHCDGKCYLAKRLRAAQEREEQSKTEEVVNRLLKAVYYQDIVLRYVASTAPLTTFINQHVLTFLYIVTRPGYLSGVFRPPALSY
ncbi:hypothetical protein [Arsenicibacter rosenii]|uniref:Uncharacterized protein n=1 Tax=Arsenicibacter rosenii TaxID=1750698 RepID=A0A1S2VKZ1_9BACT|nr:hypothetical protein [Arsenicibacter rosenii]OIN59070.1 hypothetical protein BLX24_12750 [Arsenicibacter rosenii]